MFRSTFITFMYGLLVGLIISTMLVLPYKFNNPKGEGLRIDKAYIKAIEPCKAELNDVYVSKMIEFADECKGTQQFFRFINSRNQLFGVTLWCKNISKSFTFYYSDKWRQENYERK